MKNKHKTLIVAAAMQGIMLGFWSAGWLCWVCENVGLSPDFLMLLAAALIFCLIFEIIQILQKLSIACPAAMGILAVSIYTNRTKAVSGLNAWLNGFSDAVRNYYQIDLQLSAGKTEAAESMFFYVLVLGILGICSQHMAFKTAAVVFYRSGACNVATAESFSGYSDNGDDNSILWRTDGLFISECFGTKPDIQCKSHEKRSLCFGADGSYIWIELLYCRYFCSGIYAQSL